jgi:hypothetical protein
VRLALFELKLLQLTQSLFAEKIKEKSNSIEELGR